MPQNEASWPDRAARALAGGPATLSKSPSRFPLGIAPQFLTHGEGATVWDDAGKSYVDCIGGLGPVLLGHHNPHVTQAVIQQIGRLTCSSLSTHLEVEVAERLIEIIPGAECVRWASNGKDVTEAAIKLARYVTGRQHVIYVGYHGGFSDYLVTTDKAGGILPHIQPHNHQVPWRDSAALYAALSASQKRSGGSDLAGIIFEVPPEPYGLGEETWSAIQSYKDAARFNDAFFIADEVVTWGRYGLRGAQGMYGFQADLTCLSKALGNGFPVAALTGSRYLMQAFDGGKVFLSTTFGASPIGLSAAKAVLEVLPHEHPVLVEHGTALLENLVMLVENNALPAAIRGNFGRMVIDWQDCEVASAAQLKTLWMQEMISRGVLVSVCFLPMTCWTRQTVEMIIEAVAATCEVMAGVVRGEKEIGETLRCEVSQEVFKR